MASGIDSPMMKLLRSEPEEGQHHQHGQQAPRMAAVATASTEPRTK
jgi:hypothetical protein